MTCADAVPFLNCSSATSVAKEMRRFSLESGFKDGLDLRDDFAALTLPTNQTSFLLVFESFMGSFTRIWGTSLRV